MANGAAFDLILECAHAISHILAYLIRFLPRWIVAPVLAEHITAAVRPVELIQIDIICVQTAQATFDGLRDTLGRNRRAVAYVFEPLTRVFGCQDDICALAYTFKPLANNTFCAPYGFGFHRIDRIHLGCVDKVDACRKGRIDLFVSVFSRVL